MENIYDLDTPALLIDLDRLEANISWMAGLAKEGKKHLRPHAKTHKTPEIARMQLNKGAIGLTCAKVGEAEVFAANGVTDIFVANQIVGGSKISRLISLAEKIKISVGVDSYETADPISRAASARGLKVGVRVEVDTGLKRSGTRSLEETLKLVRDIAMMPGLEFEGIFTYEGLIYTVGSCEDRAELVKNVSKFLRELRQSLAEAGYMPNIISVGSTPAAPLMSKEDGPNEMRCGVYVFCDRMQVSRGIEDSRCALTALSTVISVRPDNRVIIDAGTKTLASDKPFSDLTMGSILDDPSYLFLAASEEHGHLQIDGVPRVKVGDKLRIVPNHACTCVNLHDTLYGFRGEQVETIWKIQARGKVS